MIVTARTLFEKGEEDLTGVLSELKFLGFSFFNSARRARSGGDRRWAGEVRSAPLTKLMMSRTTKNSLRSWLIPATVISVLAVTALLGCNTLKGKGPTSNTNVAPTSPIPTISQESASDAPSTETMGANVDFELKDLSGKSVKLSDYRGKVVLVSFWATWCGPCQFEVPAFVELQRQYQRRGFEVIGISMDEGSQEEVAEFARQYEINYPVVMGAFARPDGFGKVNALPTTFLIDRNGHVHSRHKGLLGLNEIENELPKLLRAQ